MSRALEPGEVRFGPACDCHGMRRYERKQDDGSVEIGVAAPAGSDLPATGYWQLGKPEPGAPANVRTIVRDIRFTARGPAQVATGSYRLGWEETFGGKAMVN